MTDFAQLPLFEGLAPSGTKLSLGGAITCATDQPARALQLDEQVVMVVVGTVDHVGFDTNDLGPIRGHRIKITSAFELEEHDSPEDLLEDLRGRVESVLRKRYSDNGPDSATGAIDTVTISHGGKSVTTTPEEIGQVAKALRKRAG